MAGNILSGASDDPLVWDLLNLSGKTLTLQSENLLDRILSLAIMQKIDFPQLKDIPT